MHQPQLCTAVQVLLSPERLQPVEHMPAVVELLGFILIRDPAKRPTAGMVAQRYVLPAA